MTQSYWRTWLSLTLSLDDSGLISSSDLSHEAACKVLEYTKSHEELKDPNSDLFTGTFIKKRVEARGPSLGGVRRTHAPSLESAPT